MFESEQIIFVQFWFVVLGEEKVKENDFKEGSLAVCFLSPFSLRILCMSQIFMTENIFSPQFAKTLLSCRYASMCMDSQR